MLKLKLLLLLFENEKNKSTKYRIKKPVTVKKPQGFTATNPWNNLQSDLQIQKLVTLNELRTLRKGRTAGIVPNARCMGDLCVAWYFYNKQRSYKYKMN